MISQKISGRILSINFFHVDILYEFSIIGPTLPTLPGNIDGGHPQHGWSGPYQRWWGGWRQRRAYPENGFVNRVQSSYDLWLYSENVHSCNLYLYRPVILIYKLTSWKRSWYWPSGRRGVTREDGCCSSRGRGGVRSKQTGMAVGKWILEALGSPLTQFYAATWLGWAPGRVSENGEEEPGEKRRGEEWLLGRSEVSRCLTGRCWHCSSELAKCFRKHCVSKSLQRILVWDRLDN